MSANSDQIKSVLSGAINDPARPVPHMLHGRSYLNLFEPGSQLYKICEALEATTAWLSTLDLHHASGSMAVSTKISQVRERIMKFTGKDLIERDERKIDGKQIHFYRLRRDKAA